MQDSPPITKKGVDAIVVSACSHGTHLSLLTLGREEGEAFGTRSDAVAETTDALWIYRQIRRSGLMLSLHIVMALILVR